MIKLIAPSNLIYKLNLNLIQQKIEFARESGIMKAYLKSIRFDERYTKPHDLSAWDILEILYSKNHEVVIGTYTQSYLKWKMVPVNAYKPKTRSDEIFINTRQLERRTSLEWEETIWHELAHIADHLSVFEFGHGKNNLSGKDETAPVKFARIMASMTMQNKRQGVTA